MPVVNRYRVPCITDQVDEEAWGTTAPTKCPVDTAHTIDAAGVTIVEAVSEVQQATRKILASNTLKLVAFGWQFTAAKASTTDHDGPVLGAVRLRGAKMMCVNADKQDYFTLQLIDKDNVTGQGGSPAAPTVIAQYAEKWNLEDDGSSEIIEESVSDALPAGLYFRVQYRSAGTTDVDCRVNVRAYKDE